MARKKKIISRDYYELVAELASEGKTITEIAFELGMSKATLDRRIAEDPDLKTWLEYGRSKCLEKVESVAYQMAVSGMNIKMTMFWLRHKAGWKN